MNSFAERLKFAREKADLKQVDVSARLNLNNKSLSNYETGRNNPDFETLAQLAKLYNVSTDYLIGVDTSPVTHKIPVLKDRIAAGIPVMAGDNIDYWIEVPDSIKADFACRVQGDSMVFAGILDDDFALFQKAGEAYSGQIIAAVNHDNNDATNIKYFIKDKDKYLLRSANPTNSDQEFTQHHRVAGIYVGVYRDGDKGLDTYRKLLSLCRNDDWSEVVEVAASFGFSPKQIKTIVEMQGMISKKI